MEPRFKSLERLTDREALYSVPVEPLPASLIYILSALALDLRLVLN